MLKSLLLLAFVTVVSCGSAMSLEEMDTQPRRHATFVTGEELRPAQHPVLYDALTALRPTLLRTRGGSDSLVVVIDGTTVGSLDALRSIRTADVLSVERTQGLRQQHGQSALLVRLR